MERFVPNYTCKKAEQTGITCVKILIDYFEKVNIYEKEIKDYSEQAVKLNMKITENSPWKTPIIYDLASYALHKGWKTFIVKEEASHIKDPHKNIEEYSKNKRTKLIEQGLHEEVNKEIVKELVNVLNEKPVALLINLNKLYAQTNLGIGWLIITEYNPKNDEFIIYDPMYYTRVPKTRYWERLPNTMKKRFISFKKDYFLKNWEETKETIIYSREAMKKEGFKPFMKEFLYISHTDT